MSLLQEWRDYAYSQEMSQGEKAQMFWANYFQLEQGIYEQLLAQPDVVVEGTVEELAKKYEDIMNQLKKSLNTNGWDGRWFRRAFTDNGETLRKLAK